MSGGGGGALTGTTSQQIQALLVVALMGTVGGILIQILMKGIHFKTGKVGPIDIKPCMTKIQVPPLVGMIIFGCLARNTFCTEYMQHYPEPIAAWVRSVCLSIILLRGGMELDFKGKGLIVVLLTLVPQNAEAIVAALACRWIFNMPWALCFAEGYTLGAVSPAVLVPSCMILQNTKYGTKKGIPTSLIAASSFDDIIAISIFSIFLTVSFTQAPGGEDEGGKDIWAELGLVCLQIFVGLVAAFAFGAAMKLFNRCDPKKTKWPKFFVVITLAIAAPFAADLTGFPESKFIFVIFFGYMCFRNWGEDKPEHELAIFWMFCQPFLFSTVGAAVLFNKLQPSMIGYGLAVICIGVSARWLATFLVAFEKKYNNKERAFMAFAWIPKATVQAALGGLTLAQAQERNIPEYIEYGQAMLTTAVFAIVLTAPLGAIMINTLGTKWLEYDGDDPELLEKHGLPVPNNEKDDQEAADDGSQGKAHIVEQELGSTRPRRAAGIENVSSIQDESHLNDEGNVEPDQESYQRRQKRRHNKINSVTPLAGAGSEQQDCSLPEIPSRGQSRERPIGDKGWSK